MKLFICFLLLTISVASTTPSFASRPGPDLSPMAQTEKQNDEAAAGGNDGGIGGFFGRGSEFRNIPGFGKGWGSGIYGGGYGGGYGGPNGGYSRGGVVRSTVVCKDKGPCFHKKLTCPAKCFTSYSQSGKGYGSGGGGGGCTMDCQKKCIAYC